MSHFNRNNKKNIWHSPIILLLILFLIILFLNNIINLIKKENISAQKKNILLSKIEEQNIRERQLNNEIEKLNTERGVEELLREKYQVVKNGEKMVVIVDNNNLNEKIISESKEEHGFIFWLKNLFN